MSSPSKGTLQAVLEEVEPGLFRAQYPGEMNAENATTEAYPDAHIGTDPGGVKMWVEQMAGHLGYDRVEWVSPDST